MHLTSTLEIKIRLFTLSALPKRADGTPIIPLRVCHCWAKRGFFKLGRLAPL
ncbi:hypothetical protein [Bartonella saheliensis]|uniref:hypothetical protein n=1 Tax=Bartonella saheliensis TaxID=1457016 RepID=UPI00140783B2|nr:hypothetical protein [Bartonella saheliensis]